MLKKLNCTFKIGELYVNHISIKLFLKVKKSLKKEKGNYSTKYWMNIHGKFLNKILVNQVLWSIKWIITKDHMGLISGTQVWFNKSKSINVIHHMNGIKGKHHMLITIDAEKSFDKIQHSFVKKILPK